MKNGSEDAQVKLVRLPRELPHQVPILQSPARFKVVVAGRRWGKSIMGLLAVVDGHGPEQGTFMGAVDGASIWWVAPTYGLASIIWRDLKHSLRDCWNDKSEVERRIVLPNGGSVSVKSADNPDGLRGAGLDGVVLDEAAFMTEATWTEAIRPALSDRQGWAVFISTPDGQNWFQRLYQQAEFSEGWDRWHFPTSNNPLIPPEEIEAARREIGSHAFAREYLAEFVGAASGMFRREWFEVLPVCPAEVARVRFWDLAATRPRPGTDPDWTAGTLMAKDRRGVFYIADIVRTRDTPGSVEKLIRQTAELDGSSVVVGMEQEPGSSGINTIDHYRRDVLPGFAFYGVRSTGAKELRASPLSAQAEAGNVKLVHSAWNRDFLAEAEGFPGGTHMDQIDSAASAFQMLAPIRIVGPVPTGPPKCPEEDGHFGRTDPRNPFEEMITWKGDPFDGMV